MKRTVAAANRGHRHHGPVERRDALGLEFVVFQQIGLGRDRQMLLVPKHQVRKHTANKCDVKPIALASNGWLSRRLTQAMKAFVVPEHVRERNDNVHETLEATDPGWDEQRVLEPPLEMRKFEHAQKPTASEACVQPRVCLCKSQECCVRRIRVRVLGFDKCIQRQRPDHVGEEPTAQVVPVDGPEQKMQFAVAFDARVEAVHTHQPLIVSASIMTHGDRQHREMTLLEKDVDGKHGVNKQVKAQEADEEHEDRVPECTRAAVRVDHEPPRKFEVGVADPLREVRQFVLVLCRERLMVRAGALSLTFTVTVFAFVFSAIFVIAVTDAAVGGGACYVVRRIQRFVFANKPLVVFSFYCSRGSLLASLIRELLLAVAVASNRRPQWVQRLKEHLILVQCTRGLDSIECEASPDLVEDLCIWRSPNVIPIVRTTRCASAAAAAATSHAFHALAASRGLAGRAPIPGCDFGASNFTQRLLPERRQVPQHGRRELRDLTWALFLRHHISVRHLVAWQMPRGAAALECAARGEERPTNTAKSETEASTAAIFSQQDGN
ncbi:hypothetical protein FI667_g2000, partial [Globisporangium splendens]